MSNIPLEKIAFILKTKHWEFKGLRLFSLFTHHFCESLNFSVLNMRVKHFSFPYPVYFYLGIICHSYKFMCSFIWPVLVKVTVSLKAIPACTDWKSVRLTRSQHDHIFYLRAFLKHHLTWAACHFAVKKKRLNIEVRVNRLCSQRPRFKPVREANWNENLRV